MLGVNVMPLRAAHVVDRAVAAEQRGIERLVLPDQGARTLDPWVLTGAAAGATSRIRLGMITNPYTRRPEATAVALQTLDELSGGRGFVVLSVGGAVQLASMGVDRVRPLDALARAIDVVRERHPRGELWVATKGPKALRLAGARADGILLSGVPLDSLPEVVAGLELEGTTTVALTLHHRFDRASEAESRERVVFELLNMRDEFRLAAGVDDALVETVRAAVAARGPSRAADLVPLEVVRRFALDCPIDGLAEAAADLLDRTGLDELILPERSLLPGAGDDGAARQGRP